MDRRRWFYNGTCMSDGTPITIAACGEVQEKEFIERGFRPVETDKEKGPDGAGRKRAERTIGKGMANTVINKKAKK
ncbi:MAG TPA: hypothetical protein VJM57_00580 [Thermodesulfobacteriota bacterium]|nr:hypothetical protein [Thermodesulfobacteriota bacterium]